MLPLQQSSSAGGTPALPALQPATCILYPLLMNRLVWFSIIPPFGIIIVNNPPVNALNPAVVDGIERALRKAEQEDTVKAIILAAAGRTFIAGTDIDEFRRAHASGSRRESLLNPLLHAIEDCGKPVVCAIHGTALGGGLEMAMACHYRIADGTAQVGQPEVKLGLIPGGGGTQRLPRLSGVAKAAAMCSEGSSIGAYEAFRAGIVDRIADGALLPSALQFARKIISEGLPLRRTRDFTDRLGDAAMNKIILSSMRERIQKRFRGQLAPLKALDAVEASFMLPFDEGCRRENEIQNECLASDQSKALIHVFFAEREVAKIPEISSSGPPVNVQKAAVVGAGSMGTGIAMAYANAGIPVLLMDTTRDLVNKGLERIHRNYESAVKKGQMQPEILDRSISLINPVLAYEGFSDADVVVEAVYEDLELKRQLFRDFSAVCKPEAILATNTSSLDIDRIASAASDPARVVGHHFFAPANVMQLIEVVRGRETDPNVIVSSMALAKRLKKIAVVVGNCRGFAANRMYYSYQRQAQFLVEEGAEVEDVDRVLYDFGMAMGPFATRDLSGLDIGWRAQTEYASGESREVRLPLVLDRLYKMGRLGQKTGAGWYRYQPQQREPMPDPEVRRIIRECAQEAGIQRRPISSAEILERTIYAMINEGARILEEGIVQRAMALDLIFIAGYGFPRYKGGPMWFADRVGLKAICDRLDDFHNRFGSDWTPAPLLKRLAFEGKSFSDYDKERS